LKKVSLLFCTLLSIGIAKAQFTKLFDFNGTNGDQPFGSVIPSDNDTVLYGMTNGGGTANGGFVYSIHNDGTAYEILHTFTQDAVSGSNPYGSLIRSGNTLYGMTSGYGIYSAGTIFSIHTDGSGYTKLYDFNPAFDSTLNTSGGGNPNGTLTLSGNILYGMTYGTSGPDKGNVFSINTDGSNYTSLLSFDGNNGQNPGYGALVESAGILYGTTLYGGANGLGVVFSVHTDGTNYSKILDFNTANGSMPFSSLSLVGNKLYGTTSVGGAYNKGLIFSVKTDGTGYADLFDFTGTSGNGQNPNGALTLSGGTFYGATAGGGTNTFGTLFSIDTSGTGFQTLFSFNTPNGTQARATLSFGNGTLYGTAVVGGAYGHGTIFKFTVMPPTPPICLVTVDSTHTHNLIVWEKTNLDLSAIDSFIVYREITTNNYQGIGAVSKDSLSTFDDFNANPATTGYRYKLKSKNSSGVESNFSDYHNTIYLTNTGANFSWTPYQIENNSTPVSAYNVYRDDYSTGNFQLIGNTTGNQFGYTDVNFSSYPNASYYVEAVMTGGNCNPTRSSYNGSRSNVKALGAAGVAQLKNNSSLSMYPNPADNTLTIEGIVGKTTLRMYDVAGKLVIEKEVETNISINTNQLPNGVYTLLTEQKTGKTFNRVVISH
jgi:uncharacterized repeat protein (TIGR03803 family)